MTKETNFQTCEECRWFHRDLCFFFSSHSKANKWATKMIMQGRGLLCKYPNVKNKKAIMFYNMNSWLISSMHISSQCTKRFHMKRLVWVPCSPMGRQHCPFYRRGNWGLVDRCLADSPMVQSDGPVAESSQSSQWFPAVQRTGKKPWARGWGGQVTCVTWHRPKPGGW